MNIEKMREQFEKISDDHYLLCERSLQRDEHQLDEYLDPEVQIAWEFFVLSREAVVVDIRPAAKKWFYETFDDDLLEKMEKAGLIAQAEGYSASVMAELELDMEKAIEAQGLKVKA